MRSAALRCLKAKKRRSPQKWTASSVSRRPRPLRSPPCRRHQPPPYQLPRPEPFPLWGRLTRKRARSDFRTRPEMGAPARRNAGAGADPLPAKQCGRSATCRKSGRRAHETWRGSGRPARERRRGPNRAQLFLRARRSDCAADRTACVGVAPVRRPQSKDGLMARPGAIELSLSGDSHLAVITTSRKESVHE